ncbi:heparinase II/III family protein [Ponticoccus sp. SC2-23]|uniref:heparinase II/III family protein n=1 Tax=Alexandriicola marinus TaxID=2081710 RepID=UPI000FD7E779|nr:heparinase II/III family protein [Alexandriicola marinus]MBM1220481.1 heparinase II/III family protein [Ponticoccus sp. SC6-9]MBM1225167.1 heparinase II/III family protein [Ponticoccus sp. SC6-15]MBM1228681.1 heparinase II/III family protein [Ponticoccus sp. SC6-38]MBM1233682.1 heparinase II/III family protein [Ponticoccus sp. SC6-45]MBM1239182.1 heparinase II/III family protein [Ponticoccus sp. SC6-49]MBM1242964.1 heparinase II/III family protein [Ponticoccus sp. SC2-64]MBM1247206.1 hepa
MAGRAEPASAFVTAPEPRTIGLYARGRQLIAGNFLFAGHLIEAPDTSIWDIAPEDAPFAPLLHGCAWLDDLAAVGDHKATERAQTWVYDWIERFGRGTGPGWTPGITGRRLIRWINHAILLMRLRPKEDGDALFASLSCQTRFLVKRWKIADPGIDRLEALTGVIYAGLALEGMQELVAPAIQALGRECIETINEDGSIPSRNPEELLEVLTLLNWAALAIEQSGQPLPLGVAQARQKIAPTLRALRHSDGSLARFHGGGRGLDGWLDAALSGSGSRERHEAGLAMGYAHMLAGRTSIIADAAPPPRGPASARAHASTLAMELTSGRRPLIVNCGSGASFGEEWRRAGRATPSHSTLSLEGYSSSRLAPPQRLGARTAEMLSDVPDLVPFETHRTSDSQKIEMAHNGWQGTHGLTHARTLEIAADGRALVGEDYLTTLSAADETRFDRAMDAEKLQGIPYAIRFHLHPDVDAEIDMGGAAVSMALKSGEVWILRQIGAQQLALQSSVYLETGRLRPRSTKQVVLTGRAMSYATRIRWSLAKAQETPTAVRDYAVDPRTIGYTPDGREMQDEDVN